MTLRSSKAEAARSGSFDGERCEDPVDDGYKDFSLPVRSQYNIEAEGSSSGVEEDLTPRLARQRALHLLRVELLCGELRYARAGEQRRVDAFRPMFEQNYQHSARIHELDGATPEVASLGGECKVGEVHDVSSHFVVVGGAREASAAEHGGSIEDLAFPTGGKSNGEATGGQVGHVSSIPVSEKIERASAVSLEHQPGEPYSAGQGERSNRC